MNSFVRPLRQYTRRGGTVEKECKKYFAFYVLFPFGLWMQCGIQVLPGYANRMPTGDAHVAIYKARYIYTYISYVCVLSLLALTCAKIHWSPTGGSLIFCCLAEGAGKREGGGGERVTVGALAEVPLAAQPIQRLLTSCQLGDKPALRGKYLLIYITYSYI